MGYIAHHAIVVTGMDFKERTPVADAATYARSLGMQVIGPGDEVINGYRSFLIAPDGSKEGWNDSDCGNDRREAFKRWLKQSDSGHLDWAEIRFGGDNPELANVQAHDGEEEG